VQAATVIAALFTIVVAVVVVDGWEAFGRRAEGARRALVQASPEYRDGHFNNSQSMYNDPAALLAIFRASPVSAPRPEAPANPAPWSPTTLATPPASGLRVTWMGHAWSLVEIDGARILTDPALGDRASPFNWVGPSRFFPAVDVDALRGAPGLSHEIPGMRLTKRLRNIGLK
jgi:hypothetical protein